jgi:hypothetical protein
MTIDEKLVDIKCTDAKQVTNKVYDCLYKSDCMYQMSFGYSKICVYELRKQR